MVPVNVAEDTEKQLHVYWSDDDIVEIMGVIALFGYLNRWNDVMATSLEGDAKTSGQDLLKGISWAPRCASTTRPLFAGQMPQEDLSDSSLGYQLQGGTGFFPPVLAPPDPALRGLCIQHPDLATPIQYPNYSC